MHARAGEPVVQRVHGRFFQFLGTKKGFRIKRGFAKMKCTPKVGHKTFGVHFKSPKL